VRDARHHKVEEPAPQPLIEIYKYSCIFVVKKIPKSLQKNPPLPLKLNPPLPQLFRSFPPL
jgi:hypothetical protein